MMRIIRPAVITGALILSAALLARAQGLGTILIDLKTMDPMTMFASDDPAFTDPAASEAATSNPPHFPKGGKFKLFGSAADARDPQNQYNEVISTFSSPTNFGGAYKQFGDHVKVRMLTDLLGVKYYLVAPRDCIGGSPRFQLAISIDGDKSSEGNAFGYVGHGPFGSGCVQDHWDYIDMTDEVAARWDLTQFGGGYTNWEGVVAFFSAFPNHRVLSSTLVDDSGWAGPTGQGCAYYDLVTAGGRTLDTWDDTSDRGKQPNGCP